MGRTSIRPLPGKRLPTIEALVRILRGGLAGVSGLRRISEENLIVLRTILLSRWLTKTPSNG